MSSTGDNKDDKNALYEMLDSVFQAEENLEEDQTLARKCGISIQDAALRALWVTHDEREENAQHHLEIVEKLNEEAAERETARQEEKLKELIESFDEWRLSANKRSRRKEFLCILAVVLTMLFYNYVGLKAATLWAFCCLLWLLTSIEDSISRQTDMPRIPRDLDPYRSAPARIHGMKD